MLLCAWENTGFIHERRAEFDRFLTGLHGVHPCLFISQHQQQLSGRLAYISI